MLVRHGSLPREAASCLLGASECALSAKGREEMRQLGADLAPLQAEISAVISSDLRRCQESAKLLLSSFSVLPPLHTDARLREISLGQWQGLRPRELLARTPALFLWRGQNLESFVPPDGESFRMLKRRCLEAVGFWRSRYPSGLLLLLSHAGVLRTLLATYLALPLNDVLRIPLGYASHVLLEEENGAW